MSRVLASVLGAPAGPGAVRPRLPTMFEPGLDIASGPEDGTAGPGDIMPELASAASPLAVRLNAPPIPADAARELPSATLTVPHLRQPTIEPRPPAPLPPSPLTEPAGGPAPAGPRRTDDASPVRPARPGPAHPVRPEPALPAPPSPAGPAAPRPRPRSEAAAAIMPVTPADQAPPPARREPVRPGRQPDAGPAPAPRRSAARQAHGAAVAEPTVHIEIGRVEIRADRAAARQSERPASRRRPAAPDLSEYLKRRGQPR